MKLLNAAIAALILVAIQQGIVHRKEVPSYADPVAEEGVAVVVARKALAGEFGKLPRWQEKGYSLCLEQKPRIAGLALVTHYGPPDFPRGAKCRHGYRCSESTAAANRIPAHNYVLLELKPGRWELRRVEDTGAKILNAQKARRAGCKLWIDRWTPSEREAREDTWRCRYAVITAD